MVVQTDGISTFTIHAATAMNAKSIRMKGRVQGIFQIDDPVTYRVRGKTIVHHCVESWTDMVLLVDVAKLSSIK